MLQSYLKDDFTDMFNELKERGWRGAAQFCPYSEEPLELDLGVRAVSLLGLRDLKRMVETPDKYVLLVAGPCNVCGLPKTEAIEPLLVQPALNIWTHLAFLADMLRSFSTAISVSI